MGRSKGRRISDETILVVGLGLFGSAVARTLTEMDVPVIAVTPDHGRAERYAEDFTHVIELNPTDRTALEQIGVGQVRKAVVALSDVEQSIMTVLALAEAGVQEIWARAATREHGSILERIGAHHVVYTETSTGRRVARAVSGYMLDYFEFEGGFAMARTKAPSSTWDKSLYESRIRTENSVTVVGVKRANEDYIFAAPTTVIRRDDEVIVAGRTGDVDAFCRLT